MQVKDSIPDGGQTVPSAGASSGADHGLKKNALGAPAIAFFIIAAASPLTGTVALVPVMIGTGNGIGTPGSILIAAAVILLFAVGYIAMSKHVHNAGALYAYVTTSLGRVTGLSAASLTIFAYSCIQFSLYGGFGYYVNSLISRLTGVDVPWWILAVAAMLIGLGVSVKGVHAGGVVLGVGITLECAILFLLAVGVISGNGGVPVDYSFEPLALPAIFSSGVGVSIMLAQAMFIGVEASVIYSEEARDPRRTIPRATYFAVGFMAVVYAGMAYLIISAVGLSDIVAVANEQSGDLIFYVANIALGPWAALTFEVLICTAIFAAALTFHNNISRYFYAMGRQGLISRRLGHTLPKAKTPHVAAIVQTTSALIVVLIFAIAGLDPYTTLFVWFAGIGTIAIMGAYTIAAIAIFVFFRRTKSDPRLWNATIAPLLAIIGLSILLIIALFSVELLLGTSGWLTWLLVGIMVLFPVAGAVYARWLRGNSPEVWDGMNAFLVDGEQTT